MAARHDVRPERAPKPAPDAGNPQDEAAHPELTPKEARQADTVFRTSMGLRLFVIGAAVAVGVYVVVVLLAA